MDQAKRLKALSIELGSPWEMGMWRSSTRCGRRRYWPGDGAGSTTSVGLTAPWPVGLRRQRPNSPGRTGTGSYPLA